MPESKITSVPSDSDNSKAATPDLWQVLGVWLRIGVQSFGGGPSTNFSIRNEFIYKRAWLKEEEYASFWVLCQLVPGVNLIALTILIGKKFGGAAGIAISLFGMLFPSTSITLLLAVGFSLIQGWPPIQAMLKGLTPATAGISLVVALQFANPLMRRAKKEGYYSTITSLLIIGVGAIVVALFKLPVVIVFLGAAMAGALVFGLGSFSESAKKV